MFRKELQELINRHSKENGSDTPDYILAEYLDGVLSCFDKAVIYRENHCGRPVEVSSTDCTNNT